MDAATDFVLIFAACYLGALVAYFGLGAGLMWWNARHPDRRIQKDRRGEARAAVEIRQSVLALLPISACLAGGLFFQAQGWVLVEPLPLSWWSVPLMFAVTVLLFDAWFYWFHRAMHLRVFYRWHLWHHRSVAPSAWSNYSDDLVDALVMQSFFFFAPLVLPIPALVLVAVRLYDHVNGQLGHSGFEYFAGPAARNPWPGVCTTFHDQHHELFAYNYGNFFSFWDRAMGTLHPDYDNRVRGMEGGALPAASRPLRPRRPAPDRA